jgi:hypothetical protein
MRSRPTITPPLRPRFFSITELYGDEISLMVEVAALILFTRPSL